MEFTNHYNSDAAVAVTNNDYAVTRIVLSSPVASDKASGSLLLVSSRPFERNMLLKDGKGQGVAPARHSVVSA
jgi:hypothetical protein